MSSRLTDKMRERYPSEWAHDAEKLIAGVYIVTAFEVMDDEKFRKRAYIKTKSNKWYTTTSHNIIGGLLTSVGEEIKKALEKDPNGGIEVEVVPKQANTGRWGIAFKAF